MNYASLSLVDISFRAVQPLFFSTPIHLGGLGLLPPTIGTILSCYGILNGTLSIFFFARIHERWGTKKVFLAGVASAIPVFATFPILNAMARVQGLSTMVWIGVAAQVVLSIFLSLSYGELTTSKLRFSEFSTYSLVLNLSVFLDFSRLCVHLHRCCISEPGVSWRHEWNMPMCSLDHACIWTNDREFALLAVYGERLSRRISCLRCVDWRGVLGPSPG